MGLNVDLCQMLGLPEKIQCPRCLRSIHSDDDDYDIECGDPNPTPGHWTLRRYCPECENEWEDQYIVMLTGPLGLRDAPV